MAGRSREMGQHPGGFPRLRPSVGCRHDAAEIAATESDPRAVRNKAKIRATVENAREVLALLDTYGSIGAYFKWFPDAHAASADMRRRFKFLGDSGLWRLLTSAARDIGG
jgi:3-methyladenine DNA glycosylase Tag